jgi:hypothetical protein
MKPHLPLTLSVRVIELVPFVTLFYYGIVQARGYCHRQ